MARTRQVGRTLVWRVAVTVRCGCGVAVVFQEAYTGFGSKLQFKLAAVVASLRNPCANVSSIYASLGRHCKTAVLGLVRLVCHSHAASISSVAQDGLPTRADQASATRDCTRSSARRAKGLNWPRASQHQRESGWRTFKTLDAAPSTSGFGTKGAHVCHPTNEEGSCKRWMTERKGLL